METKTRPTKKEVFAMLELDPAHDALSARTLADLTLWDRTHDGLPMTWEDAKMVNQNGTWHTRFSVALQQPPAVRRGELISADAAVAKAGVPGGVATLAYKKVLRSFQRRGTRGDNAMDFVRAIGSYELVYLVRPASLDSPSVYLDPYTGAERARYRGSVD